MRKRTLTLAAGITLLAPGCDTAAKKPARAETNTAVKKADAKKSDAAKKPDAAKEPGDDKTKGSLIAAAKPPSNAASGGQKKKGFLGGNGEPCDTELEWYDDDYHDRDANWDDAEHFGWGDFDDDEHLDDEAFDDHDEELDDDDFDDDEVEAEAPEPPARPAAGGGAMRQKTKEESVDKKALSAPSKQFTIKCTPGSTSDFQSNRTRVTLNLQGGSLGFIATSVRKFSGYGDEGDLCADYRETLTASQYLQGTITVRKIRYFRPWDGKCHTWMNTETGLDINGLDFTLWGVSRTEPVDTDADDCR